MAVKIGKSYVSEAALNYAKAQSTDEENDNILKNLSKQFPNLKFSIGTSPFSGTGTNNVSISPKILNEMKNNPEKKIEYEALIYDIANLNHARPGVKSAGFIIGDDGGLRGWSISGSDNSKNRAILKKNDSANWWDKLLGNVKKKEKKTGVNVTLSKKSLSTLKENQKKSFEQKLSVNEFMQTLREKFSSLKNGVTTISNKYLRECLNDEEKQKELFDKLQTADDALENAKKILPGLQSINIKIDDKGNMKIESSGGKVVFNESKRARQLAAAQSQDDVQALLNILQIDLDECEEGLKKNMCDESEVEKVKKMIERAKQRMNEVERNNSAQISTLQENFSSLDILI